MTTFQFYTLDDAPEGSKANLAEVAKASGFVPQLHGNLAESPLALEAYDRLFGLVTSKSTLSAIEQQVADQAINPIMAAGKIIGGIGVSGVLSTQDAQIANSGVAALARN